MRHVGVISGVSVSHRNATVDEIESATRRDDRTVVGDLLACDGVEEAFALQTCNRAEAYVVTDDVADGRRALADFAPDVRDGAVVHTDHEESLRHLMCVAAGLDSLVLGEDQIIGQFRTAMADARAVGGVGPLLDDALVKALHVGERARTETGINEGVVSLGSAAVELVAGDVDLSRATALVVGAGEMGRLTAQALAAAPVEQLIVANRTIPHAEHVASTVSSETGVDAEAVGLDALSAVVERAELVVVATESPTYVLDADDLADAGETLVIDISQPRDVDPAADDLPGVTLYDIDALEAVTERTRESRAEEAAAVEQIVEEELARLLESFKRKRADEAISEMYEGAARVKAREVDTALSKLEAQGSLTPEQRQTVEALADSLVGQLLAAPTRSLRDAAAEDDWTTIQTAMRLFSPDFDGSVSDLTEETDPDAPDDVPDRGTVDPASLPDDVPSRVLDQLSDD